MSSPSLMFFFNNMSYFLPEVLLFFGTCFCFVSFIFFKNSFFNVDKRTITITILVLIAVACILVFQLFFCIQGVFFYGRVSYSVFLQAVKLFAIAVTLIIIYFSYCFFEKSFIDNSDLCLIILLTLNGIFWALSSEDLLIFFLAFEIQSLGFYVLTGLKRYSNSSVTAALNYFFYGALFSCFFLLAITLLYFFTGSTSLFEIHSLLISLPSNDSFSAVLVICIWFSIFVVFFKLAVFPFHFWIAEVYEGAPSVVLLFFYIVPKLAYFIVLLKLCIAFAPIVFAYPSVWVFFSFFTILVGSVLGLYELNFKRFLAYSAITNIGFMMLPIFFFNADAWTVSLEFFISYSFASINLISIFLVLKSKYIFKETVSLPEFAKILWLQPRLAFMFVGSLFSIAGIPPFGGSLMKFLIIHLFVLHNNYFLTVGAFFLSILSLIIYIRFIRLILFNMPNDISFLENSLFKLPLGSLAIIYGSFFFNLFFLFFFQGLDKYIFDLFFLFLRFYIVFFDFIN